MKPDTAREVQRVEERDAAVSPVIGVILMVAITVILAAVIGTFVLGLGGKYDEPVQAGVNVNYDPANTKVDATYVSAQTADIVNVTFNNQNSGATQKGVLVNVGDKLSVTNETGNPFGNATGAAGWYERNTDDATDCSGGSGGPMDQLTQSCELGSSWASSDRIGVTVTAVKGDQATVVLTKDNTI